MAHTEIQDPPSFILRTDLQKAAFENGFRVETGLEQGWFCFKSTTAPTQVWLSGASDIGPWHIAINHLGVAAELNWPRINTGTPGIAASSFVKLPQLYTAIERVYQLAVSLPDAPLATFQKQASRLPQTTEAERLVVQRVGQNIFRDALLEYWGGKCPLTGISDKALLRASHIVAWVDCDDDRQRLDVHNGLLLSALWDAAFDAGKVSFSAAGTILAHPGLSVADREFLFQGATSSLLGLKPEHLNNLARHRERHGFL
jgi:HNH endonuclease